MIILCVCVPQLASLSCLSLLCDGPHLGRSPPVVRVVDLLLAQHPLLPRLFLAIAWLLLLSQPHSHPRLVFPLFLVFSSPPIQIVISIYFGKHSFLRVHCLLVLSCNVSPRLVLLCVIYDELEHVACLRYGIIFYIAGAICAALCALHSCGASFIISSTCCSSV